MKKKSASRSAFFNLRVLFGFVLTSVGVFLALLGFSIYSSSPVVAQPSNPQLQAIHPDYADISAPVRDYPAWPTVVRQGEPPENPYIFTQHANKPDTVVQKSLLSQLAPSIPATILNFDGIPDVSSFCNCEPPDTNGEVGATQYVQIVNDAYQVFDKTNGTSISGPNAIESIWTGMSGSCATDGQGDPVVLYDQLANRWIITEFAGGLTHECVAVSTTNDATGSYARYDYNLVTVTGFNGLFDYPHLGVWPDGYYMSMNVFNSAGTLFMGPQGFAFNRTKMLAGDLSAEVVAATRLSSTFPPMLPADLDGATLPPAGAPDSFILWPNTNTYRIYHFHVDFANPANSTFTLFGSSPAASFTQLCPGNRNCIPQKGTTAKLDALGDRLMFRAAYRNMGDHESLVGNFTVSTGGHAGIRWFELRGLTNGPVTTFQESTYSPDSTYRWMGSIAMDSQGNMALGFSSSDSTIFPQIRYAGRLATDPINTLAQGEAHLFDGTGSQSDTSFFRWGDYSDMTVDPVDDKTFWYTQEYYATTSSFNWRTRIGNFKLAGGSGGGANLVSAASRLTHASAGTFDVNMPLTGPSGVEDRIAGTYTAVFTFDTAVTSGTAQIVSGTATAGTPTFSGNSMIVPLTGVANAQIVTIKVTGVNGGTTATNVPFGFLIADVNANRIVDKPDQLAIKAQENQTVTSSNFRDDVDINGMITKTDANQVLAHKGQSIP